MFKNLFCILPRQLAGHGPASWRGYALCAITTFITYHSYSQIGGKNTHDFLNLPVNARVAAMGGVNVSLLDYDVTMYFSNPALLNKEMVKYISLNYMPFYAGIKNSTLAYAHDFGKVGIWGGGLQYINYGKFQQRDASGNYQGDFRASEYALYLSYAHKIENYTLGANLKFVGSNIQSYSAYSVLLDLGGLYSHPTRDWDIGMVFKNIGFLKRYPTKIPFDVQLGMSYKLEHMPLRASITMHHLNYMIDWLIFGGSDIVYLDPNNTGLVDEFGNETSEDKKLSEKIARHFIFGGEFVMSPNFYLRAGYNHQRRKELKLETRSGLTGFSAGFMIKVKTFEFAFSRAWYHVAGGKNYITVTTNLGSYFKKTERPVDSKK